MAWCSEGLVPSTERSGHHAWGSLAGAALCLDSGFWLALCFILPGALFSCREDKR